MIERISTFDEKGSREGGVIWHTTGSGKSFTMVFFSKALIWLEDLAKCRVIVVTDRVDLETQLSQTFASGGVLSDRDKSDAMATSGRRLAQQIGHGNERVIFSIINKFGSAVKYDECYNDSPNIIVMVDEGHRSQNGENNIRMAQACQTLLLLPLRVRHYLRMIRPKTNSAASFTLIPCSKRSKTKRSRHCYTKSVS